MINIQTGSNPGSGLKLLAYLPFVTLKKSNNPGVSKKSDGTTNADGTLYPSDLNNSSNIGSLKSFAAQMASLSLGLATNDDRIANNAMKTFVGENYFSKYKKFMYAKVQVAKRWWQEFNTSTPASSSYGYKVIELDSTRALMVYTLSNGNFYCNVITRDASDVITLGTPVLINGTTSGITQDNWDAVLIDTDRVLFTWVNNHYLLTISGDVVTNASNIASNAGAGYGNSIALAKITTNQALMVYSHNTTNVLQTRVISVSGTTITESSVVGNSDVTNYISIMMDTTTKGLISYYTGTQQKCLVFSVSGTTVTLNTAVNVGSAGEHKSYRGMQTKLATDKYLLLTVGSGSTTSPRGKAFVISVSGTVPTPTSNDIGTVNPIKSTLNSSIVPIVAGTSYFFMRKLTISGTTVTQDSFKSIGVFSDSTQGVTYRYQDGKIISWGTDYYIYGYKTTNGSSWTYVGLVGASAGTNFEFYDDATIIGSVHSDDYPLFESVIDLNDAISTGKKCYFGIKNTSGATRTIALQELVVEVE